MTRVTAHVTTVEAVAALLPAWRTLYASAGTLPFQSPDWLTGWWEAFRPGELCLTTVTEDGELVAIAPMWRERGTYGHRILPMGIGLSDQFDVLLAPRPGAAADLSAGLARTPGDWDVIALEDLPPDARALELPPLEGFEETVTRHMPCPVLTLAEGFNAVPARQRQKWRMAARRAARRGHVDIEHVEIGEAVGPFLDDLVRLNDARWRESEIQGVFTDPRVRLFLQEVLPLLVEAGVARLYLLSIDDRVVGAYCGFRYGTTACAYLGGYDPDFAHESPGTILMGHAISEAVREGARSFAFLRGDEAYKFAWGGAEAFSFKREFRRGP